jgi:hypothetical protein
MAIGRHYAFGESTSAGRRVQEHWGGAQWVPPPLHHRLLDHIEGTSDASLQIASVSTDRSEIVRGDWTPLEFFIASVRGWEAGSRRLMGDGKLDKS